MSSDIDYRVNPHGSPVLVGVIGGSGVYKLAGVQNEKHYSVDTPFGKPSADVCVADVRGVACAFLPRHSTQHTTNPSEVNYRANVYALRRLGVRYVIAINAVGSLEAERQPGDIVLVDQVIDRTTRRESTFYEGGIVAHVDFAHPTSSAFRHLACDVIKSLFPALSAGSAGWRLHETGTIVTMEGPQFSTRAESLMNRQFGGHLIGMTTATEAKLAREAEMAYLVLGMVTDMDAWSDAPHVDCAAVQAVFAANAVKSQECAVAIIAAVGAAPFVDPAHSALKLAVQTRDPAAVSAQVRRRLAPLLANYPQYAV